MAEAGDTTMSDPPFYAPTRAYRDLVNRCGNSA
jgi:hypothetical protein